MSGTASKIMKNKKSLRLVKSLCVKLEKTGIFKPSAYHDGDAWVVTLRYRYNESFSEYIGGFYSKDWDLKASIKMIENLAESWLKNDWPIRF